MPSLEAGHVIDESLRDRHDFRTKLLDVPNPVGTNQVDPTLPPLRVAELAGAVVTAGLSGHLLGIHMTAGPDGVEGPVIGVDHDGVPGLVAGAVVEIRRERLWIWAGVSRSA